jgi:hypothetical protein
MEGVCVIKSNNQLKTIETSLLPDIINADNKNIELLRRILTRQQHREVIYDEAALIGESLIEFFEILSEDA